MPKIKLLIATVGILALSLAAASPAAAQSRYDRDSRDDSAERMMIGAVVGALAGALISDGDEVYIYGGALAGAALAADSNTGGCGYYRGGRCWRNLGHWEREHGINSREHDHQYDRRDERRRRRAGRDYRNDHRW